MTALPTTRPAAPAPRPGGRHYSYNIGPLLRFGVGRAGQMLITLAVLVPLTFLLFRAVPGDPAAAVVGPDIDPAVAQQLRQQYGLDLPLPQQFLSYCRALAHGDLGCRSSTSCPSGTFSQRGC
jgi:ABC-type dipeptide/oligopeptide/nickel transport system permease component